MRLFITLAYASHCNQSMADRPHLLRAPLFPSAKSSIIRANSSLGSPKDTLSFFFCRGDHTFLLLLKMVTTLGFTSSVMSTVKNFPFLSISF